MSFSTLALLIYHSVVGSLLAGLLVWLLALLSGMIWLSRSERKDAAYTDMAGLLIVYASQTGTAEQLAAQTYQQLMGGSSDVVTLMGVHQLNIDILKQAHTVLWVVSTTGEGDAPDAARTFVRQWMQAPQDLHTLRYAILALGDHSYRHFCGFGHALDHWLAESDAIALFDIVEMDHHAPVAYQTWLTALGQWMTLDTTKKADVEEYTSCVLGRQTCLNPLNIEFPAYQIRIENTAQFHWQAGDIVSVQCENSQQDVRDFWEKHVIDPSLKVRFNEVAMPISKALALVQLTDNIQQPLQHWINAQQRLPSREYSIASTPKQNHIDLVVRQRRGVDGRFGLGSGWLTQYATIGQSVRVHIRTNHNFHRPNSTIPMILIGSGTGIAGLMAHLFEREQLALHDNWLIWGERYRAKDHFFAEQINTWQVSKHLQRCDLMFSRDGHVLRYVQDCLKAYPTELITWINRGAAIYVCGSAEGMAQAVDGTLRDILGHDTVNALIDARRYQRDVY